MQSEMPSNILLGSKSEQLQCLDPNFEVNVMAKLYEMQKQGVLCNITLVAADYTCIAAHSAILCAGCDYFRGMLTGGLRESNMEKVHLTTIDGVSLNAIIRFIYSRTVELDGNVVENILKHAHFFMLHKLVEECERYMKANISTTTFLDYSLLAVIYNLPMLKDTVDEFVDKRFMELYLTDDFHEINFESLKEILCRDSLCVDSEQILFEAIELWILADFKQREVYFGDLLQQIRFSFINPQFVAEFVQPVCGTMVLQKMLMSTKVNNKFYEHPRRYLNLMYACREYCIQIFDASNRIWRAIFEINAFDSCRVFGDKMIIRRGDVISVLNLTTLNPLMCEETFVTTSAGVSSSAFCLNGDSLYIIGGVRTSNVSSVHLVTNERHELKPMLRNRSVAASAPFQNSIYVAGGYNSSSVERYDLEIGEWFPVESLNMPRFDLCLIGHNDYLYALGGCHNGTFLNVVERYNPTTDTWKMMSPMNVERGHFDVAIFENSIVAIGGSGSEIQVERYDTLNDHWELWSDLI